MKIIRDSNEAMVLNEDIYMTAAYSAHISCPNKSRRRRRVSHNGIS